MAMKLLSVASEIYPLVKTGGLADVAGALPGALGRDVGGHDDDQQGPSHPPHAHEPLIALAANPPIFPYGAE